MWNVTKFIGGGAGTPILFFLSQSPVSPCFITLPFRLLFCTMFLFLSILFWHGYHLIFFQLRVPLKGLHLCNIFPDLHRNWDLKQYFICIKKGSPLSFSLGSSFYHKVHSRYLLTKAFKKCSLKWIESLGKCLVRSSESLKQSWQFKII